MKRFPTILAGLILGLGAACTSEPEFALPPVAGDASASGGAECNAAAAQDLLGIGMNERARARARKLSRAESVRVAGPDTMVTQDFVPTRLTIRTDDAGQIISIDCG
ncbi:I78 family peptidase inhibitor [Fulvimarina sp. MAC8]|uniref:I78 family peptidase inhibitor n=1 Tax=Fulvimarina sp. MAC8 TaxID=3162874 RepID=UPI0032F05E22